MSAEAQIVSCETATSHCITCSDEGIPMRVLRAGEDFAECRDQAGVSHEVATDLVFGVGAGETVLVHAGVAIGRVAA
ncbi:MAG: HypC/HybG/HupF family hydrogenase formation chaperone [Solirubrobacteraceae bacterium]